MINQATCLINGQWIAGGHHEVTQIINPYSKQVIGTQVHAQEADVELALQAAYEARKEIADIPIHQRASI